MIEHLTALALGHEATARVLKEYQVDPAEVFLAAGLDPEPYRDPDSRIGLEEVAKLWAQCERLTNNPCIAFEVGMAMRPATLHALGYAWLASRTLRDALLRLSRYHRLLSTAFEAHIEEHDDVLDLVLDRSPEWPQQGMDCMMAGAVTMCRDISSDEFKPLRMQMKRERPPCADRLQVHFGCPVEYAAARDCISFRRDEALRALPRQNPELARANDDVALKYIAQMDREDVLSRAKLELIDLLSDGEPVRVSLAQRLNMSERTLGRRLSERGVSYRALLDGVRKELGVAYMDASRHAVTEVAYLLGFSDQSNFARSFRRWTGQTPSQYRAERKSKRDE